MRRLVFVCTLILFLLVGCLPLSNKAQVGVTYPGKGPTETPTSLPLPFSTLDPDYQSSNDGTPAPDTFSPTPSGPTHTPRPTLPPRNWPEPGTFGSPPPPSTAVPAPITPFAFDDDVINILLLGSDRRTGRYFRTDIIIVLSIHPSARAAVMISIPRDLYVYIPGYTMQRVNTAYLFGDYLSYPGGGIALLKDTILYNFGITIDHYALIEMKGFEDLVDTLGGVDIHVACSYTDWRLKSPGLDQNNENNWHLYTVSPGIVHANGEFALWYARSRKRSSDFDRSRRQQEVLRAIFRKILSLDLIPRIPSLYSDLTSMVQTDLGVGDLISMAPLAFRIDLSRVRSRFIGTDQVRAWTTPTGGAVQLPKPGAIEALLQDALYFEAEDFLTQDYEVTVEVINASSYADWATLASERLMYAGFEVEISSEGATPSNSTRLIDYGLGTSEDLERLQMIMNLRSSSTTTQPDLTSPYTYSLYVGNDFSPCFNPTTHQGNP